MYFRFCISAIAICALSFTGCGGKGGAGGEKTVGAALLTQTHVFYQDMAKAMREEADARGLKLRIQYAEFDSRKQNDQMETFIAQGVDAIIVSPCDSSGVGPVVAEAAARNIPVFTADIAAHGAKVVAHVASDNVKGGALMAEFLAQRLGGKGKIGIIEHPTVASASDRVKGFTEALAKFPDMTIAQRVPGEGQRDKAMRAAQDLLQAHPDLAAIFGINDDSALGALAAVEAAGLQDKVVVAGFDGTPEARQAIKDGKALKADAVQYPDKIGKTAIDIVADYFAGKTPPASIPVEVGVITQESLNAESGS